MHTRKTARLIGLTLAAGAITTSAAAPALANPANVKPKFGTYKGHRTGPSFRLVVGYCGFSNAPTATCVYTPGGNNYFVFDFTCVNASGTPQPGGELDDKLGPQRVPANGVVRVKGVSKNNGEVDTSSYLVKITSKGTMSGTARATQSYPNGTKCDSGAIAFTAKR